MASRNRDAFAIWITGLPASGKSTLAAALKAQVEQRGIDVAVLESDRLREVFTPRAQYGEQERETFYRQMAFIGSLLVEHGVAVIFDATANRRSYRDAARSQIPRFLEVYVDSPLAVCQARDPKGIYRAASEGNARTVPGVQAPYEAPERPEVVVRGGEETPPAAASRVVAKLAQLGYISD